MAAAFNKHAAGGDPCCGGGIEFERPYLVTLHDSTYSAYASRVGRLVPSVGSSPPTSEDPSQCLIIAGSTTSGTRRCRRRCAPQIRDASMVERSGWLYRRSHRTRRGSWT